MMPSVLFYSDRLKRIDLNVEEAAQSESYWCTKLRKLENLSTLVTCDASKSQYQLQENVLENERNHEMGIPTEVRFHKQFNWPIHFRGVSG